jgi:hypothetical protein
MLGSAGFPMPPSPSWDLETVAPEANAADHFDNSRKFEESPQ